MSNTFSDKPLFNLKQFIAGLGIALTVGAGIARFEYKTNSINSKLDAILATNKVTDDRMDKFEVLLTKNTEDIKAVTTSLTAVIMLKPEDIKITNKR